MSVPVVWLLGAAAAALVVSRYAKQKRSGSTSSSPTTPFSGGGVNAPDPAPPPPPATIEKGLPTLHSKVLLFTVTEGFSPGLYQAYPLRGGLDAGGKFVEAEEPIVHNKDGYPIYELSAGEISSLVAALGGAQQVARVFLRPIVSAQDYAAMGGVEMTDLGPQGTPAALGVWRTTVAKQELEAMGVPVTLELVLK